MKEVVTVSVVCNHLGREYHGDAETIFTYAFNPKRGGEPTGFLNGGGRVFIDGEMVELEPGERHFSAILRLAVETGTQPVVKHQLWCPCGITVRRNERDLTGILERAAGNGVLQLELAAFDR